MRILLQRVARATVSVEGNVVGAIEHGLLLLVGVRSGDTEEQAAWLARKVAGLRVFADPEGKMNLDVKQAGGRVLAVSQFTLYADAAKGNRPSYIDAARPEIAQPLFERFCTLLEAELGAKVERGVFGADMQVELVNDGPVTIMLEKQEPQA